MTAPIVSVAHGAPTLAIDAKKGAELFAWASAMPKPKGILVVSPHWETRDPTLGATTRLPLLYDFSGFPPELYQVTYDYTPAPELADRTLELLSKATRVDRRPDRKLDHGAWTPLLHMYPKGDVPVVQLSLPRHPPEEIFALGRTLAPLAEEGVMLMSTAVLVHNLRSVDFSERTPTPPWAKDFDAWCADVLEGGDFNALIQFRVRAPKPGMAHPTEEHFLPIVFAAGAASTRPKRTVTFPVVGWELSTISRRCVQIV